jgi:hypothetical protein
VAAGAVTVRPAAARDLDAVVAIERASFGDPWNRESFASALADRNLRFEVAAAEGDVAGYIVYWLAAGEGELANIAVARCEGGFRAPGGPRVERRGARIVRPIRVHGGGAPARLLPESRGGRADAALPPRDRAWEG